MDDKTALEIHISNLEANQTALLQEKEKMEEDFGLQRAKLKDLFLQKEEELNQKTNELSEMKLELDELQSQVNELQLELEEARSQVTIAQCTAENEVEVEKRKYEEEIASVQQIMQEEITNAEDEVKELRVLVEKFQHEKQYYRLLYEKNLEESESKRESLLSPSVLAAVTKSLTKRVPSLSPSHSSIGTVDKPSSGTTGASSPSSGEQGDNLEESMKRAQEDATLLRSLVIPLEEEITALKGKIREQDAQLRTHESHEQMAIKTADVLAPLFQGKSAEELVQELDEKLQGVKNTLEVEKASRADLELYTAILNTQKTALTDHVERLRGQMADLQQVYDEERKDHNELKHTWQRANDQFLEAQRLHLADVRRMRTLLNTEQLHKFHELQRLDSKEDNSSISKGYIEAEKFYHQKRLSSSEENLEKETSEDTVSTALDLSEGLGEGDVISLEGDSSQTPLIPVELCSFTPKKIPQLTDDQKQALSGMEDDHCVEEFQSASLSLLAFPRNQRVVSEVEWRRLQDEIKKSRSQISDSCLSCSSLPPLLKKLEGELKECEKEKALLEKAVMRQREELERETAYRKEAEEAWKRRAEEFDKKEKELQIVVERAKGLHSQVLNLVKKNTQAMEEKLKSLTDKRESAQMELIRLQNENDNLIGKHSKHSQDMQNEIINLPDTMEEMQLLLLRYREDVISAKVAKEHIEETSNSKILFLKDQMLQEQHERVTMEDKLNGENDHLRSRLSKLEGIERKAESETRHRLESEVRLKEAERKVHDSSKRSQQLINGLKLQIDEQNKIRNVLERDIMDLKSRIASLQRDLETSEAVQRDFVRLSQSLQVQLEKIRQSEKEVRWQHEEDIDECNNCKQRFTPVGRRKNHCKHCGKIFCSDCVMKTVPSGPNSRSSRVCDVCHTLLVQDATPFFSREPPQSPG